MSENFKINIKNDILGYISIHYKDLSKWIAENNNFMYNVIDDFIKDNILNNGNTLYNSKYRDLIIYMIQLYRYNQYMSCLAADFEMTGNKNRVQAFLTQLKIKKYQRLLKKIKV